MVTPPVRNTQALRSMPPLTDWTKPLKSIDVWNFAEDCV